MLILFSIPSSCIVYLDNDVGLDVRMNLSLAVPPVVSLVAPVAPAAPVAPVDLVSISGYSFQDPSIIKMIIIA